MPDQCLTYLSKLVEVMLHIFDGGVHGQSANKDLLCPGHQLATDNEKESFTTNHIGLDTNKIVFVSVYLISNVSKSSSYHSAFFPFSLKAVTLRSHIRRRTCRYLLELDIHCMCVHKMLMVGGWVGSGWGVTVSKWTSGLVFLSSVSDSNPSQPELSDEG